MAKTSKDWQGQMMGTGTHVRKAGLPNHNLPLLLSISLGTMTTT